MAKLVDKTGVEELVSKIKPNTLKCEDSTLIDPTLVASEIEDVTVTYELGSSSVTRGTLTGKKVHLFSNVYMFCFWGQNIPFNDSATNNSAFHVGLSWDAFSFSKIYGYSVKNSFSRDLKSFTGYAKPSTSGQSIDSYVMTPEYVGTKQIQTQVMMIGEVDD